MFQEERRSGREMNCLRTGESWYMADDGRDGVERTQAAVVESVEESLDHCPSILPPSGHGLSLGRSSYIQC